MKHGSIESLFDFLPRSKVPAAFGLDTGPYPFYTSSDTQSKFLDKYQYEPGCLVLGTGGNASIHLATKRFSTSTDCIVLRPKSNSRIDVGYGFQYLKGNIHILEKGFKGAGLKHISKTYISAIQIPYPEEIADQRRIVSLLSGVQTLIAQRRLHLQQLEDLSGNIFQQIFGTSSDMKSQHHYPLGNFIEFLTSGSRGWAKYYSKSGSAFIRINNVRGARLRLDDIVYVKPPNSAESTRTKVKAGDLLLSITADLGRTAVVSKELDGAHINQHLALIRIQKDSKLLPIFLAWYFTAPYGRSLIQKLNKPGVKAGLNFNDIRRLPIVKPSEELQRRFVSIVTQIDNTRALYEKNIVDMEILYAALNQIAFKGEVNLSSIESHHDLDAVTPTDNLIGYIEDNLKIDVKEERSAFNTDEFNRFLDERAGKVFTATGLWDALNKLNFEGLPPTFASFKSWILNYLESGKYLDQVYESVGERTVANPEGMQIAFRIKA